MSLEEAKKLINKKLGGNIFQSFANTAELDCYSTGDLMLDYVCGRGFPKGRLIEISGAASSGKTTLAVLAAAECQKQGGRVLFLDYELSFHPLYAEALGLNIKDDSKFIYATPPSIEDGAEIIRTLAEENAIDFIILDSIASAPAKKETEGDMGVAQIGIHARTISQVIKQLTPIINEHNICLVVINQLRKNIGVMGYGGPTETTPGGEALRFYASLRLRTTISGQIKKDIKNALTGEVEPAVVGNNIKIQAIKNKVANPFRKAEIVFYFGKGIDASAGLLKIAKGQKLCTQSGAYYDFGTFGKVQGENKAIELIKTNVELTKAIQDALLKQEIIPVAEDEEIAN